MLVAMVLLRVFTSFYGKEQLIEKIVELARNI
jgi:hypothetical protein